MYKAPYDKGLGSWKSRSYFQVQESCETEEHGDPNDKRAFELRKTHT